MRHYFLWLRILKLFIIILSSCRRPIAGTYITMVKQNPSEEFFRRNWAQKSNDFLYDFLLNPAEIGVKFGDPSGKRRGSGR